MMDKPVLQFKVKLQKLSPFDKSYVAIENHVVEYDQKIVYEHIPQVNGVWRNWSTWSFCSTTSGGGTLSKSHDCNNPALAHGGDSPEYLSCANISWQCGVKCRYYSFF